MIEMWISNHEQCHFWNLLFIPNFYLHVRTWETLLALGEEAQCPFPKEVQSLNSNGDIFMVKNHPETHTHLCGNIRGIVDLPVWTERLRTVIQHVQ